MKKKNNKKGFTLAELLIVVAIIAVLTAIAIPVFSTQLEKAREATDVANIRSAYAEVSAALLTESDDDINGVTYTAAAGTAVAQAVKTGVPIKQQTGGWVTTGEIAGHPYGPDATGTDVLPNVTKDDTVKVTVKADGTWVCEKE